MSDWAEESENIVSKTRQALIGTVEQLPLARAITSAASAGKQAFAILSGKDGSSFKGTAFPANVGNAKEHPHYMVFNFVVPETVYKKQIASGEFRRLLGNATDAPPVKSTAGRYMDGTIGAAVEAGANAGNTLAKAAADTYRKYGSNTEIPNTIEKWGGGKTTIFSVKTSSMMIGLLMPNQIHFMSAAGWAPIDADPSFIGSLAKTAGAMIHTGDIKNTGIAGFTSLVGELIQGAGGILDEGASKGIAQALSKSLENPFTDMAFQTMQRRQFQFSWQLFPKDRGDAQRIAEIIKVFRFHMHPNLNETTLGAFLDYPSYIVPSFYFGGSQSPYLPRISLSVIDQVETDLTPNGQWSTYTDGFPAQINLTIVVSEVQPLLKEDIALGF